MQTELELIKCMLLGCKMIAEIRDLRKEGPHLYEGLAPPVTEGQRTRIRKSLRYAISLVALVFLKGSGVVYYGVSLAQQALELA